MGISEHTEPLINLISRLNISAGLFDRSGSLLHVSDSMQVELGFSPNNIRDLLSWFSNDDETLEEVRASVMALEEDQTFSSRLEKRSGNPVAAQYDLHASCSCAGNPPVLVVRVEPSVRESIILDRIEGLERLAMVGQVATGVAHEFNNILTSMLGWTQIAVKTAEGNDRTLSALETIENNTKRAKQIASELLDLSRPSSPSTSLVPISEIVEESLRLLSWELGSARIEVKRDLANLGYCDCNTTRLLQVFVNIIRNAIEATPSGGTLTVEAKETDRGASISFTDSGNGIPESAMGRIFEPFFTTKVRSSGSTGGSGLGLAICKRITEEHGGEISAESRRPGGTTVTVDLPLGRASQVDLDESGETRSSFPPGIAVLVVDDEPDIGEMIGTALTLRGANVEVASGGEEALRLCKATQFDAAFVDFTMNGLSGHELGHALAKAQPSLPIVFMSGVEIPEGGTGNMHDFLKKPFDLHEIQCKLREVLDA